MNGCAPGFAPVRQVGSEDLALDDYGPHVRTLDVASGNDTLAARGTQVGSEGVKARANADHQIRTRPWWF